MSKVMDTFGEHFTPPKLESTMATLLLAEQVERLADAAESMAEGYRGELAFHGKSVVEMIEGLSPDPPRLRLHPDGHWMPDTPGEWDYTRRGTSQRQSVAVYPFKGGLNVRFADGAKKSTREVAPGAWEWVPPAYDEEITP